VVDDAHVDAQLLADAVNSGHNDMKSLIVVVIAAVRRLDEHEQPLLVLPPVHVLVIAVRIEPE